MPDEDKTPSPCPALALVAEALRKLCTIATTHENRLTQQEDSLLSCTEKIMALVESQLRTEDILRQLAESQDRTDNTLRTYLESQIDSSDN